MSSSRLPRPARHQSMRGFWFSNWSTFLLLLLGTNLAVDARERLPFNDGWRFVAEDPAGTGDALSYEKLKPWLLPSAAALTRNRSAVAHASRPAGNIGRDVAYTQAGFDDGSWRSVILPHDWAIEGPFKQEYSGWGGKLKWWGVAWYRKHFTLSREDAGQQIYLDVDGAMSYASVWVNGQFAGGWPYGYTSWRLDITPFVKSGAENIIAIRLDNPPDSSRWYPGSGLYRNVWLVKASPVHVGHNGIYLVPTLEPAGAASVAVTAAIENHTQKESQVQIATEIFELKSNGARGRRVKVEGIQEPNAFVVITSGGGGSIIESCRLQNPKRWSPEQPNRYLAVTRVRQAGHLVDELETPFGFRSVEFTADRGLLLNGEQVRLNGVCDHHDLGALGAAVNTRALERQLEILKAMGGNAIRTSHNPPAPELLDLCDRLGFLVMAEAFDCWHTHKCKNDYGLLYEDWHEADLRTFIRRDRNHPCVALWSIGNEIPEQTDTNAFGLARELAGIVHEEDPTRPVSAGCNATEAGYNGFQKILDVFGYNYKPNEYDHFRAANPGMPIFGSETASCVSSRGEYFFPVSDDKSKGQAEYQMSSYDLYAPDWATPPDWEFKGQDQSPFVAGEFVWTGFDYLGEPTPYGDPPAPSRSSYFGIVDLAGFPKDRYYIYQARWRPDLPMAHILPHWTWPERTGQVTPVHVYTSGDSAELFLNGRSLGRKAKGKFEYRLRWDKVVYEPGELKAVAYKNGRHWATDVMRTAGPAAKLLLAPDRAAIATDGKDLCFVTVKVTDQKGCLVPRSKNVITFAIEGPGDIVATDNGDATSFESFQASQRRVYNGLALVIVRARPGLSDKITLKARSPGLMTGACVIRTGRL